MITTLLASFALCSPQMPAEALDAWARPAGLRILRTHLTEGDIVVYLPGRMSAGDMVSGSVFVEAAGESAAQQSANAEHLSKYTLDAMGSTLMVSKAQFSIQAPQDGSPVSIVVRSEDGGTAARMTAETNPARGADEPAACPVVEYGTAIRVVGSFDGRRDSTFVWLDGVPAGVLAEGSRDCVVSTMNAGIGAHKLKIRDGGVESEHMINVVRMDVRTPVEARIGKKTAIEVSIDGLEGIDNSSFPLNVVLMNNAPKLFPFGEGSTVPVTAESIVQGRWNGKVEFKPKKKGEFSVVSRLVCEAFLKRIGESN